MRIFQKVTEAITIPVDSGFDMASIVRCKAGKLLESEQENSEELREAITMPVDLA